MGFSHFLKMVAKAYRKSHILTTLIFCCNADLPYSFIALIITMWVSNSFDKIQCEETELEGGEV